MVSVLDINDICLLAEGEGKETLSPGYALLQKGENPVIGEAALKHSRLSPAITASRFWRDLSLNPVGINHPQVRHQADLVWHQVKQINAEIGLNQSLFLCPSHYGEEQLGLLSGILKALEISPSALVKRSLAAATLEPASDWHLEFQLHQILLTHVRKQGGEVVVDETRALAGDGYLGAVDAMLKAIQKRFIKETRFDPLHHANTEQQLVDLLPEALQRLLAVDTTVIQLQTANEDYRAEIRRDELEQSLSYLWQEIRSAIPEGERVLVDQTLFQLPGFGSLALKATEISQRALSSAARNLPLPSSYDPEAPIYLTRAVVDGIEPSTQEKAEVEPAPPSTPGPIPAKPKAELSSTTSDSAATHLLCQGVAMAGPIIWLGLSPEGRLAVSVDEPGQKLAQCKTTAAGLEIEAISDIQINGEKLVGRRLLTLSDHLSSNDFPGGITAIRVIEDAD